jgi:hypothetical protein
MQWYLRIFPKGYGAIELSSNQVDIDIYERFTSKIFFIPLDDKPGMRVANFTDWIKKSAFVCSKVKENMEFETEI